MSDPNLEMLRSKLSDENYSKLEGINNKKLFEFLSRFLTLCNPDSIFVCNDSKEDMEYIRQKAIENGEEAPLAIKGHTYHFDNYLDQARDKNHTNILLPKGQVLDPSISTRDRDEGLEEIMVILKDIMKGKEAIIAFFSLGPPNSIFTVACVQITDSFYVAHNEFLLYRKGYDEFVKREDIDFLKFVHSAGELDERKTCKNLDKRRIYIDIQDNIVYSTNNQYGGNSIGLKKLAMRLTIKKASTEGWLTEHMLVMGIHGPNDRVTYFTGAFPSLCGKTSTAMLDGETIVGDDIAYLRNVDGEVRSVNVERGMFGIIQGINSKDDPLQWKALHSPNDIIFSNILVTEGGNLHWIGKDGEVPDKGINHSGEWFKGKKDAKDKIITCSHPNARFTLSLSILDDLDPKADDPLVFWSVVLSMVVGILTPVSLLRRHLTGYMA